MSVSIYYQLERPQTLSEAEQQAIDTVLQRYDVSDQLEHYLATGQGYNWESFSIYDDNDEGVVFAGATKLPNNSDDASIAGLEHWLAALSDIRRALSDGTVNDGTVNDGTVNDGTVSDGTWQVELDDLAIAWDDMSRRYVLEGF